MCIILYLIYFIELTLICPSLGNDHIGVMTTQSILNFFIMVFFFFNCIVNILYCLFKSNKNWFDYTAVGLLFAVITFIPVNNFMVEKKKEASRSIRVERQLSDINADRVVKINLNISHNNMINK
ncbi:Intracellular septation protein A [Gilliamella apicola SCGC AB-598-I20]|nr:Intracellular septation protein A [Gilliamella apicola SCGC AB-598-I20]